MARHDDGGGGRLTSAAATTMVALALWAPPRERVGRRQRAVEQSGRRRNRSMFEPYNELSQREQQIYAAYEIAYTLVDFGAALAFTVGSVLFLYEDLHITATWFFIVGSVLFLLKPTIRLLRELQHLGSGHTEKLARKITG